MNNLTSSLMFTVAISGLSLSCSQINPLASGQTSETSQRNQSIEFEQQQTADLKWLRYADPVADANFAIENQDFTLLAFAGRATSFPGMNSDSSTLQQQCGYRLLPNSGDALRSESELILRKKLYQYAATYNQLIAAACQKNI